MISKIFGLFLFTLGLLSAGYLLSVSMAPNDERISAPTLYDAISTDLERLSHKKILPQEWNSIRQVAYNFKSTEQAALYGSKKLRIKEDADGANDLEIEFIDVPDGQNPMLILQMSLKNLKSQNKIWELGREYAVKPYIKKTRDQ